MPLRLVAAALLLLFAGGCNSSDSTLDCTLAGGRCVLGNFRCPNPGPQDCNPDRNPGGAVCCLPCPQGLVGNDAGTACVPEASAGD